MKPLKLVIKGLNSFIEEQTIDFEKLTDRGLFGIFGPTGSGKSTILDGITLALYGDLARKSSNFINTNCNDLNVSYTFQISGAQNRVYVVNRQFRRDKKTGNAKTHAASVKELTEKGEEVLAESVTTVNKTCRDILGLSLEDFTRTVVLPQGKFSEFLKLEGKQRREMLERLFNLQDYGERLSLKLSKEINVEKEKSSLLMGELNAYEDISEEKLKEETDKLVEVTRELEEVRSKQQEIEAKFKEGEEIWKLQNELSHYKREQQILESQEERMKAEEEKLKRGESAFKIYPYLASSEKKKKENEKNKEEEKILAKTIRGLTEKKKEVEEAFETAKKEKEEKLPYMQAKSQQLMELIQDYKEVTKLESGYQEDDKKEPGIGQIEVGLKKVQQLIEHDKANAAICQERLAKISQEIEGVQVEEKALKVEVNIRQQVDEGVKLTQSYAFEKKNHDKNMTSQQQLTKSKADYEVILKQLEMQLDKISSKLEHLLSQQGDLLKQPSMTQDELLNQQEKLASAREKWQRLEHINKEIKTYLAHNQAASVQMKTLQACVNEKTDDLEQLKKVIEASKVEQLAHRLREHLHEGAPCLVCGSLEHKVFAASDDEEEKVSKLKENEEMAEVLATELATLQKQVVTLEAQVAANKSGIEKLENEKVPLMVLFQEKNLEQQEEAFLSLSKALQQFEENKRLLEEKIVGLKEEKNKLESEKGQKKLLIQENEKQLAVIETEMTLQLKDLEEVENQLKVLKKELGTQDFEALYQEIKTKDKKREDLLKLLDRQDEEKQKLLEEKEKIQEELSKHRARFEIGLTKYDGKQKNKEALLRRMETRIKEILELKEENDLGLSTSLKELLNVLNQETILKAELKGEVSYESVMSAREEEVGDMSADELMACFEKYPLLGEGLQRLSEVLQALSETLEKMKTHIERHFNQVEAHKTLVDQEYETTSKKYIELTTQIQSLNKQLEEDLTQLDEKLREEDLTVEEVERYLLTKEQISSLKDNIEQYKEDCAKLMGAVSSVQSKLGARKLESESWDKLQEEKRASANEVSEVTKAHTNLATLVKTIEEALDKLGKLREEKKKRDHQMALLTDLEKLFKGKRFVEFVAATRLKYVSLEASKKLKEITGGIYGLEVDEDGRFIIRDFKNGGAKRDASTLSGGETFLASLALALSLSAEIQLKGTAPLELFFLDEGFGTLDDDLLEVVMSSLEQIHHDKLKVGIISHVESIKNRVPVKLLLTPAESGRGGTKVKMDRS